MIDNSLEGMLAQGFTKRMAKSYLDALEWERESGLFDQDMLEWAHAHGFRAESLAGYDLDAHDIDEYMTDYEYARLWPLNSWQRVWINDKLTLKGMLAGTPLDRYIPRYFYYSAADRLLALADSKLDPSFDGFISMLENEGAFACKPCNGEGSSGFHKLAFKDGAYFIDGKAATREQVASFIAEHPNYVFTEFIAPHELLAKISPAIHTLRMLVINPDGASPKPAANYLRFGVQAGTEGTLANYRAPIDEDMCSLNCTVDFETGSIEGSRLVYANRTEPVSAHPDSGALVEGTFPYWNDVLAMVHDVALHLGALEYLGFDIGVTDDGPKIMEINSHSGLPYLQLFTPLRANTVAGPFYEKKIAAIDALQNDGIAARNGIVR